LRAKLTLFCLTLLSSSAALGDEPKARAEAVPAELLAQAQEVLQKIGWPRPPDADSFRSGNEGSPTDSDLRIWTLPVKGGPARPVSEDAGYSWPVFGPDGKSVAALAPDGLVVIDAAKKRRVLFEKPATDPPYVVLGWTSRGISLVTLAGRVLLVDATSGIEATVERVGASMIGTLIQATRSCENVSVSSSEAPSDPPGRPGRSDVLLFTKAKATAHAGSTTVAPYTSKNLTRSLKTTRHTEPALSPDCKQIVFVGAP
jgi:hypothetical protein